MTHWFEPDFVVGDDSDILAEGFTLNQLLRDYLVLNNDIEEPTASSDLKCFLVDFFLCAEEHEHLAFDLRSIEASVRILVVEVELEELVQ